MTVDNDLVDASAVDLSQRRVVILGGTGAVAEGIVRAWLRAGAEAVVPTRSEQRAQWMAGTYAKHEGAERLHPVSGDYTGLDSAEQTAQRVVDEFGPVTDVVASIGDWWQGKALWQIGESDWQRYFVDLTTAHVASARAWIPRLTGEGSYHLILGGSATIPVPGASVINMEQAALLMMHRALSAEAGSQRRIHTLVLGPVDTRQRSWADPEWVSTNEVGLVTVTAAASGAPSADHDLHTKDQVRAVLQSLKES